MPDAALHVRDFSGVSDFGESACSDQGAFDTENIIIWPRFVVKIILRLLVVG